MRRPRRLTGRRLAALLLLTTAAWSIWPLLLPRLRPARGASWIVVLDGYHRLDQALARQARLGEPILLISCPLTDQPNLAQWQRWRLQSRHAPLLVLRQGYDTATQAEALARWLQQRSAQRGSRPGSLHLLSDPHHFPRASLSMQLAVGSLGVSVQPLWAQPSSPPDSQPQPLSDPSIWRDALRLQLWRLTGSSGSFLAPARRAAKVAACFGPG